MKSDVVRSQFEGVSLTENIENHAKQPLYKVNQQHPHHQFFVNNYGVSNSHSRLTVKIFDETLKKQYNDLDKILKNENPKAKIYKNPLDFIKVKDINCPCNHKMLYEQVLPGNSDDAMAYKSCKHTIYAAAKRQMKAAPTPELDVALDFIEHSKNIIEKEIGEDLNQFGYSYNQWYNHLNNAKQRNMRIADAIINHKDSIEVDQLSPIARQQFENDVYEGICKVEIQNTDGKPRMVCAIPHKIKYIMGPITWKLEELCAEKFNGYCGGKNLTEMEQFVNDYIDQGFTKVVEGDGSAFDNTQDALLKEVDRYIYRRIADKVYHCPKEEFLKYSQALTKTQKLKFLDPKTNKMKTLMEYTILGSVFSGDCDTTLMNTLRMALYNRYVNDKAGLKFGIDYVTFAKGDDFTVMYKPYISDDFITQAYYKYFLKSADIAADHDDSIYGLGQVLKFLEIGSPNIIKFCSLRAWEKDPLHIYLTRDPKKFFTLSKYSIKAKNMTHHQLAEYLRDQALAINKSYKGVTIFDTMSNIYRARADYYDSHASTSTNGRMRIGDSKQTLDRESKIDQLLYDIQYRRTTEDMQNGKTYWETMKNIYNIRTDTLNSDETQFVNNCINREFDPNDLITQLALTNE